ncbi:MAG TPA: hypothetical protein VMM93_07830, partial [Vicinamibacterales bacterium]|nr:hypothetical protein [Vicinamibacterales bacterium]
MTRTRRRALVAGAVVLTAVAGAVLVVRVVSGRVQAGVIADLERHFSARIAFDAVDVTVFPALGMTGRSLRLQRLADRTDRPFLSIETLTATTGPIRLLRGRIARLDLTGLEIHVAPDTDRAAPRPPGPDRRAID